jgi:DNA polymerase I-like protein with 3'-5' exonuclease and polymerase domains
MHLLDDIWTDPFFFDYETSSYRYYEGIHNIHMISVALQSNKAYVFPFDFTKSNGKPWWNAKQRKDIAECWKDIMVSNVPKSAHNIKHEHLATKACFGVDVKGWDWCSMTAAHVLDEARGTKGLKVQVYFKWGSVYGADMKPALKAGVKKKNKFCEVPIEESGGYCGRDSTRGFRIARLQRKQIRAQGLDDAYQLLHRGTKAFSMMEQRGIRLDVPRAEKWDKEWREELCEIKERIMTSKEVKRFERRMGRMPKYKKKFSPNDLRILLFDILKVDAVNKTKSGMNSVDEESLLQYAEDIEFIADELRYRKLEKRVNTYLAQFLRFHVDGFIYPSVHLAIARSYRSSSSEPNFHNILHHDPVGARIRELIIARDGRILLTVDYGSMEVRIIACVTQDEELIDYLLKGGDMHGDIAEVVFDFLPHDKYKKWYKILRQCAKNDGTFPWFYGSYYKSIARDMWKDRNLQMALKLFEPTRGERRRYELFESHIHGVEDWFWDKFRGVREWQDDYADEYKEKGFAQDLSWGFRRRGYLTRNKLFNWPVQGPAFHCLLWSIINIEENYQPNWESLVCGQIHDDLFIDAEPSEKRDVIENITSVMTEQVIKANPWITVPLVAEWKEGTNWHAKSKENPKGMEDIDHEAIIYN